jgi:two-component system, OmpR family, sensor histidine kinase KdpD
MRRLAWRLAISVGLIVGFLSVCSRLRHVDHATVALLMVLAIVGLAKMWGWAEALAAAIVGGIGFEYFFLPPRGFGVQAPEHWIALAAFLVTAIVTGQLAAQSRRRRIEAVERKDEIEKLYQLVNALLESGSIECTAAQLADKLVEIFGADGVALYDKHTGQIVRSGPLAEAISDPMLRETAAGVRSLEDVNSALSLAPIRHGGDLVGSLGMLGVQLSGPILTALAGRVGMGLARLYAIEKTTEAEVVRRSEELKSAVLDAMAHEIRNPLNSVKLAATTLLSGHAGSELHRHEMLTIIDEEVDRMDHAIDEAVRLARVEANQLFLKKEPQNMARLIPAAISEMSGLAGHRTIQVCVPESLPSAECDKDMITRVLKQLLSNALKYSPDDSPLTVAAEFTGSAIVVDVVDGGPGVKDEERDRIFDKYYRGRAARSRAPGTGLGLASARSIVQAHGGEIWVTSPPAGGAAFHVSLPVTGGSQRVRAT